MVPSLQHLKKKFILASTSSIRAKILRNSGIALDSVVDSQVSEKIEIKKKFSQNQRK